MLNRNSARHLLLVVSILLCFFVYLGYRLLGSGSQAEPVLQYPPFEPEIASPAPATGDALRPPTDVSVPIDDGDTAWVASLPSSPADSSPSAAAGSAVPMPSVSTVPSTSHSGAITGLIPSPPADTSSAVVAGDTESIAGGLPAGLPIPSGDTSSYPSGTDGGDSGGALPIPAVPGLRPPGGESVAEEAPSFLPPPGGGTAAMPGTASATRLAPPPSMTGSPAAPIASDSAAMPSMPSMPATTSAGSAAMAADDDDDGWSVAAVPSPPSTRTMAGPASDLADPSESGPGRGGASPYGPYQELPESLRIYVVLPGDSLSSIAVRELGSASLAENIFLLNRDVIEDPDHLLAGVKIRLPVRETGLVDEPAPPDTSGRRPSMGLGRTHLVVRGDTLSSIAQQYYGTSAGWRFLYEANRNVLPNPNVLSVGTELTIPPYEE